MKLYLSIIFLTLLFSFPVHGRENEKCSSATKVVMGNMWNSTPSSEAIDHAIKQCNKSAIEGEVESQFDLSMLYMLQNNEVENEQSHFWTLKAANNNHTYAQFNLGQMYEKGVVVPKDNIQSDEWYKKAAENGFLLAQRKLGDNYTVAGKEKSLFLKGLYWYEKAAEQGDKLSIIRLRNIYLNGVEGFPANQEKANYWDKRYELIF